MQTMPGSRRTWPTLAAPLLLSLAAMAHGARTPTAAADEFTAATWNLRLDTEDDGPNQWSHRVDAVRALVRYHGIDLLGTQEGLPNQVHDLAAMPGYAWVGAGRDDGKDEGEHSAIFFRTDRFELLAHGDFWLSATPDVPGKGWDARCCNRIASWARLRIRESGREFYAFAVHFDHEGVVARRESARLMLRKMREIAGTLPAVCLGDFNATPGDEPITILSAELRDARAASESPPYGPEATFNGFHFDQPPTRRIDYAFLTPQWRVLSYATLTDNVEARYPSDHLPVVVRLRLDLETGTPQSIDPTWRPTMPVPVLEPVFELHVSVGAPQEVGKVAGGRRRLIPILGGTFSGSNLKGTVLPGGADHQLVQDDGFTQLEARYVLQTDAGEKIYVTNRGIRHGTPEVLAKLNAGERVDPSLVYFRTTPVFETEAPRLQWLAHSVFVAVGERYPTEVVVRVYRVP